MVTNLTFFLSCLSSDFLPGCLGPELGYAVPLLVLCIDLVSFFNFSCDLPKVFCLLSINWLFSARVLTHSWICAQASGIITPWVVICWVRVGGSVFNNCNGIYWPVVVLRYGWHWIWLVLVLMSSGTIFTEVPIPTTSKTWSYTCSTC